MEALTSPRPRYGAAELKQTYQQGLALALFIAVLLHLAAIFGSQLYHRWRGGESAPPPPPLFEQHRPVDLSARYREEPPPPQEFTPGRVKQNFEIGIPVPAPPEAVPTEALLATRTELLRHITGVAGPDGQRQGDTGSIGISRIPATGWQPPDPDSVYWYSRDPRLLPNQPGPEYPKLALAAGLEGRVVLKILLGTEGEVLDLFVAFASPSGAGFEEAALAAAQKWSFLPALQNERSVSAWIIVPVKFELR